MEKLIPTISVKTKEENEKASQEKQRRIDELEERREINIKMLENERRRKKLEMLEKKKQTKGGTIKRNTYHYKKKKRKSIRKYNRS